MSIQHILNHCGLHISGYRVLHGGDISKAYCLQARATRYFLKVNDSNRFPGMFEKEARSLQVLRENTTLKVPEVLASGRVENDQYLLMEWVESGLPEKDCWEKFGVALAGLHKNSMPFFGWQESNYIGSLVQNNAQHTGWDTFYRECRIMPLVTDLFNSGLFSRKDLAAAELFCTRAAQLFPVEPSALLHGDLWSGNYMITDQGYAAIFDPAGYYGHREMEIGMTLLFGGFNSRFYDAYNEAYPLEKNWQKRLPLTQLYPLLVHALLFGGLYIAKARAIIQADI